MVNLFNGISTSYGVLKAAINSIVVYNHNFMFCIPLKVQKLHHFVDNHFSCRYSITYSNLIVVFLKGQK